MQSASLVIPRFYVESDFYFIIGSLLAKKNTGVVFRSVNHLIMYVYTVPSIQKYTIVFPEKQTGRVVNITFSNTRRDTCLYSMQICCLVRHQHLRLAHFSCQWWVCLLQRPLFTSCYCKCANFTAVTIERGLEITRPSAHQ